MSWDKRTTKQQQADQTTALKAQLVDAVGPFSPFWRERFKALGTTATKTATIESLAKVTAVGERDVCPDGDPSGAAALVLQATESGWALHAQGPALRKAMASRLVRPGSYRAVVEGDTRPTSFVYAGLGLRFPIASTRGDLDIVARAGARLWSVLGLTSADVLVSALPLLSTATLQALQLAALGAGSPALFPGSDPDEVAEALRLVPATVLALPSADAATAVEDLDEAGAPLGAVRTVLLVGAPSDDERADVAEALGNAGLRAKVLAVHVADGHRLPWGECAEGRGLHTYPDLELVQLVDPETGETGSAQGAQEVVLTQLGMRGTALVRWRTADLATAIDTSTCSCGRTVPRVMGLSRRALVPQLALRSGVRGVDLRGLVAALDGRADLADWRVVVGPGPRGPRDEVVIHIVTRGDDEESDVAVAVARDVRTAAGLLPTQVVVSEPGDLPTGSSGTALSRRVLLRTD
jgi:phenylacetate-coenzyme A ligase PaaK-like adenylate-forming protein